MIAPDLIFAEVLNIHWKRARKDRKSVPGTMEIVNLLAVAFGRLFPLPELAAEAGSIAIDLDHAVYDAFYLALASRVRCPLFTADKKLHRKTRGTRFGPSVELLADVV